MGDQQALIKHCLLYRGLQVAISSAVGLKLFRAGISGYIDPKKKL